VGENSLIVVNMQRNFAKGDDSDSNIKLSVINSAKSKGIFCELQLACYFISCLGMTLYFFHFISYVESINLRVKYHGTIEVIILLLRTINEVYYKKIAIGDVGHHLSLLLGFWAVCYVENCKVFGWLVCHMQVLHFPMTIWYTGCRQHAWLEHNPQISNICKSLFPVVWLLSVGYRICIMAVTFVKAASEANHIVCLIVFPVGLLMAYLDKNWTHYFLGLLTPLTGTAFFALVAAGVLGGLLTTLFL
jgi:hypothetical protein